MDPNTYMLVSYSCWAHVILESNTGRARTNYILHIFYYIKYIAEKKIIQNKYYE